MVHEYTGLNFNEIGELNYVRFLQYKRDAFIQRLRATEQGREYLRNAYRMEQTKPDRAKLREKFKKGAPANGE